MIIGGSWLQMLLAVTSNIVNVVNIMNINITSKGNIIDIISY